MGTDPRGDRSLFRFGGDSASGATSLSIPFIMPTNGTGPGTYECKHPAPVVAVSVLRDSGVAPAVSSIVWDPDPAGLPTYPLQLQGVTAGNSDQTGDNRRKRTEIWLMTTQIPTALNPIPFGSGKIITMSDQAEVVAGEVMTCGVDQSSPRPGGTVGDPGGTPSTSPFVGVASVASGLVIDVLAVEENISVTT